MALSYATRQTCVVSVILLIVFAHVSTLLVVAYQRHYVVGYSNHVVGGDR